MHADRGDELGREEAKGRNRRRILLIVLGFVLICIFASALSALSNLTLSTESGSVDKLSPLDKARLAETRHLKQELGDVVWPGWGAADIPMLLWTEDKSFLVGYGDVPDGWEVVQDDMFEGRSYYHQPSTQHQNFAVPVGERWVASMATKGETDQFVQGMIRDMLPVPLGQIFPYRVLIQPSEVQMSGVLHESFHVYQMERAEKRLGDAESAYADGEAYWITDAEMHEAWREEIDLLEQALLTGSDSEAMALARQFLARRERRRQEYGLSLTLVAFEQRFEWLEGVAKYVELESWRLAAETAGYEPFPTVTDDPDFKGYATFEQRWSQEIGQMKRQATLEGDTRFYYTGMAQAMLLDRLLPGWKDRALDDGIWLEDLLSQAINSPE